jgi:hypothetical protein
MRSAARIASAIRGQRKALLFVGSAAALLGAGATTATASAATVAATGHAPAVVSAQHSTAPSRSGLGVLADVPGATLAATMGASAAVHDVAGDVTPASLHGTPGHAGSASRTVARAVAARGPAKSAGGAKSAGAAGTRPLSWQRVEEIQARRDDPELRRGPLPAAEQLRPVGLYGPQENMPLDSAQYGNATTIVKQALAKRMGVRSAVIAVATSMQESTLSNISYGTSDSLGLFQQRPSCGWGTAQQIMNPAYSADAFLSALQRYQAANPAWSHQPLWQSAQGVQASGFPTAYAKWEAQAASLVQHITTQQTR